MRRYLVVMLALVLLAAAPGCFPADVGDAGNLEVRLPLGSLGVVVDDGDIDAYSRYVQMKQELSEMTFDLGREGQNFYLGLSLTCQGGEPASLGGSGQWLSFDSNTDELTLSLLVGDCLEGVFSTAIYWRDPDSGAIELFTGTSDPYDLPGDKQTIFLDAYLHPAGSAGCIDTRGPAPSTTPSSTPWRTSAIPGWRGRSPTASRWSSPSPTWPWGAPTSCCAVR